MFLFWTTQLILAKANTNSWAPVYKCHQIIKSIVFIWKSLAEPEACVHSFLSQNPFEQRFYFNSLKSE